MLDEKEKESKEKILKDLIDNMNKLMGDEIKTKKDKPQLIEVEMSSLEPQEIETEDPEEDCEELSDEEKEQIIREYMKSKKSK